MDNTADRFLTCAQCDFYQVVEYTDIAGEVGTMGPICQSRNVLSMTSSNAFDPSPDFGCKLAIPKDEAADLGENMGEPIDALKPEPVNIEFFTCDNCNHFDTAICGNSSVFGFTPNDTFRPTSNFGCKLFEAKSPPAVPVKVEFD